MICFVCRKEIGRVGRVSAKSREKRRVLRGAELLNEHIKKCADRRQAQEQTASGQALAQVPVADRK